MKIHKYIIGLVAALSLSSCHIVGSVNNDWFMFDSYDELKDDLLIYAEDNQILYFPNISLESSYNVSTIDYYYDGVATKYGGLSNWFVEEVEMNMSTVSLTFKYSFLDEQIYKASITTVSVITEYDIDNLYIYESTIITDKDYYSEFEEIETSISYYICTYSSAEPDHVIYYCLVHVGFLTRDIDNQTIIAKEFGESIIDNITITTITK